MIETLFDRPAGGLSTRWGVVRGYVNILTPAIKGDRSPLGGVIAPDGLGFLYAQQLQMYEPASSCQLVHLLY